LTDSRLIVVSGPIGAGKSTLAYELAGRFANMGSPAVALELDQIADMIRRSDPLPNPLDVWQWARRGAASLSKALFSSGAVAVIIEGDFWWPPGRAELLASLDPEVKPYFVTLTVSYEEALRRVQGEPSRKMSRDPIFLKRNAEAFLDSLQDYVSTDLILETDNKRTNELADMVLKHFRL
jgi:predicted kinase